MNRIKFKRRRRRNKEAEDEKENTHAILCFSPQLPRVAFFPLRQAMSLVLTSGTLGSVEDMQQELGAKFDVVGSLPHVIDVKRQVFVGSVSGYKGMQLKLTYAQYKQPKVIDAIGAFLLEQLRVVPNGALVFFSSFYLIHQMVDRWSETGLFDEINRVKRVFVEEQGESKQSLKDMMKEYEYHVQSGAVMLAVFRGKVSEGIDFKDEKCRAVFVVGVPFPSIADFRVTVKRNFYDDVKAAREFPHVAEDCDVPVLQLCSGQEWYTKQGYRAVNQAIGRCIRHVRDFGAVILIDERYSEERTLASLSKWLREQCRKYPAQDVAGRLAAFFQANEENPAYKEYLSGREAKKALDAKRQHNLQQYKKRMCQKYEEREEQQQAERDGDSFNAINAAHATGKKRLAGQPSKGAVRKKQRDDSDGTFAKHRAQSTSTDEELPAFFFEDRGSRARARAERARQLAILLDNIPSGAATPATPPPAARDVVELDADENNDSNPYKDIDLSFNCLVHRKAKTGGHRAPPSSGNVFIETIKL